jgi:hypothetical protein
MFLGYQLRLLVKKWKNQSFKDHLCPPSQSAEDKDRDDPWNVGFFAFWPIDTAVAREHFIIQSRCESYKSYIIYFCSLYVP